MRRSRIHSLMSPEAQPTPESTRIADAGQFFAQAPHSMQASRSEIEAHFSASMNTWCGHTSAHLPQPMHAA
jgi:hypothetical protein